jgi:hypothetical protein
MPDEQVASVPAIIPSQEEADYQAICSAVEETARGRWFLAEYARRNRNADTKLVLAAIDRLQSALLHDRDPPPYLERLPDQISALTNALARIEITLLHDPNRPFLTHIADQLSSAADAIVRLEAALPRERDQPFLEQIPDQLSVVSGAIARLEAALSQESDLPLLEQIPDQLSALAGAVARLESALPRDRDQPFLERLPDQISALTDALARMEAEIAAIKLNNADAGKATEESKVLSALCDLEGRIGGMIESMRAAAAPARPADEAVQAPTPPAEHKPAYQLAGEITVVSRYQAALPRPDEPKGLTQRALPRPSAAAGPALPTILAAIDAALKEDAALEDAAQGVVEAENAAHAPTQEPAEPQGALQVAEPTAEAKAARRPNGATSVAPTTSAPASAALHDDALSGAVVISEDYFTEPVLDLNPGPGPAPEPEETYSVSIAQPVQEAEPEDDAVKAVAPAERAAPRPAGNPLAAINALSEEQKIALFT